MAYPSRFDTAGAYFMSRIHVRESRFAGAAFIAAVVIVAAWSRAFTTLAQVVPPTPPGNANAVQPAAPQAGTAHGPGMEAHKDMLRSAPPETAINDWDPRLKPEVRYAPIGEDAIIQGDIVIGKVAEVRQRTLYNLVDQANQLGDIDQLKLTDEQKAVLAALKNVKVPEDFSATAESRRESRARRLLYDLLKLEPHSKGLRGYPETLVAELKKQTGHSGDMAAKSAVARDARYRWPQGLIPYTIDSNAPNREMIAAAIDQWNTQTDRINLRQRQSSDRDYVRFVLAGGCSSPIGRQGGEQLITLSARCLKPQIVHEIGHAVGLWHEQCRNDRDNYLIIRDENVNPDMLYNFDKAGIQAVEVGTFDFASIMLYGCTSFSDNGEATIVPRWPTIPQCRYGVESGFIQQLSAGDLAGVNFMYPSRANPPNDRHPAGAPVAPAAPVAPPTPQPVPGVKTNAPVVPPPLPLPGS
jgi:hypothetical protein